MGHFKKIIICLTINRYIRLLILLVGGILLFSSVFSIFPYPKHQLMLPYQTKSSTSYTQRINTAVINQTAAKSKSSIENIELSEKNDKNNWEQDGEEYGAPIDRNKNGTWILVGYNKEIYIYSAFLDDRDSLNDTPVIRLIAVADKSIEENHILCKVKYYKSSKVDTSPVEATPIGAGIQRHGVNFKEYVLICPIGHKKLVPHSVGVTEKSSLEPKSWLHVEVPMKPESKLNFCSCVSVAYWYHEPYRIVEWMELHKLFGVSLVTIYNNSLDMNSLTVFQHYAKERYVDLRQSHNFVNDSGELTLHMHMTPVINDCILRNMHKCKKIVVTDLDEMIVPRDQMTYNDLIEELEKDQEVHPPRSYIFRNSYFFLNLPRDETEPVKLVTLQYRKRMPPSEPGYSVKSIIDPQACTNMHNHFCWRVAKKYDLPGHMVHVDPEVALNQHYKSCHFDAYLNKAGECDKMYKNAVDDDIMLKYKEKLLENVNYQLKKMDMNLVT